MQTSFAKPTLTDRLFGWWYAIATPQIALDNAPLREREFMSRAKFTSIILLIEIVLSIADLVTGPGGGGLELYVPVTITISSMIIGVGLNRARKTRAAGILVLVTIEMGMFTFLTMGSFAPSGLSPLSLVGFTILLQ